MKVFISWSGQLSKQVAEHLKSLLKRALQATEPWVSFEDIEKGAFWFGEMGNQLSQTDFGIVCLTKDNLAAPWILFEAGALSKGLTKNRVCTLLVNLPPSELIKPLSEFQATVPTQEDMLKLVLLLNKGLDKPLEKDDVESTFLAFWPKFKKEFDAAVEKNRTRGTPSKRDQYDVVTEILAICRSTQQGVQQITEVREFEKARNEEAALRFAKAISMQRQFSETVLAIKQATNEIKEIEKSLNGIDVTESEKKRLEEHLEDCRLKLRTVEEKAALLRFEMNQLQVLRPIA